MLKKGQPSMFKGRKHTEEWKIEMSKRMTGKNNPFYGKKHTEESKLKSSKTHKGYKQTIGQRKKLSDIGKIKYLEGKLKIGIKGIKCSEETKEKIKLSNIGKHCNEKSNMWKGEKVDYGALHDWIKRHKPKSETCECCKIKKPYDLAFKDGSAGYKNKIYTRNINDYEWLCRKCHMTKDGRLEKLKLTYFKNKITI